jgi:hypothetical protein
MKLRTAFVALMLLTASVAHAQDVIVKDHRTKKVKPKPPPPVWDATGWTSLGDRTVNGKYDHDTLEVGTEEGRFSKLTFVVEDSDLELFDVVIKFGNGEKFSPTTRLVFKEGSRTGVIDLPGDTRHIKKIEFKYGNLPGTGQAKIKVYGLLVVDSNDHRDPPPPPPPASTPFDTKGWTALGSRIVTGKRDRDTIKVGKYEGKFDQIVLVVEDSDMDLTKLTVWFEKGKKWTPRIRQTFKEGSRSRIIDLPGNNRRIKKIEMRYSNIPGGGQATVNVYGRDTKAGDVVVVDHRPPYTAPVFDSTGWTMVGEETVDGKHDHDSVDVPKAQAGMTKVMLVVFDSDLELDDVIVQFRAKKARARKLDVKHSFKEGQRTRAIELPIDKKLVKSIELWYGNTPGGGNARVQIWVK